MSETSGEPTRRRSSVKSGDETTSGASTSTAYEQAVEQGYFGGPADDTDYTVAAAVNAPPIDETSLTHEVVPAKAAELQQAVAEARDPDKATSA
jgi:hypothetical protein